MKMSFDKIIDDGISELRDMLPPLTPEQGVELRVHVTAIVMTTILLQKSETTTS